MRLPSVSSYIVLVSSLPQTDRNDILYTAMARSFRAISEKSCLIIHGFGFRKIVNLSGAQLSIPVITNLLIAVCSQKRILIVHWNDLQIILHTSALQTGFDNAPTRWMQFRGKIFLQFSSEEIVQYFRSGIITGCFNLYLLVNLKESGWDFRTLNSKIIKLKT